MGAFVGNTVLHKVNSSQNRVYFLTFIYGYEGSVEDVQFFKFSMGSVIHSNKATSKRKEIKNSIMLKAYSWVCGKLFL